MGHLGANTHLSDAKLCMVIGCGRKALYLHSQTPGNRTSTKRGYCAKHRDLAIGKGDTAPYGGFIERRNDEGWVPLCSDK